MVNIYAMQPHFFYIGELVDLQYIIVYGGHWLSA